ncbi:hypothetical protein [Kitasatospora sp. MBT63]|uniref:hypothetical protein n=1 Tax=Kitasatospora sp. MBT63 TaxID=1444768 RepID=UPI00053A6F78|nr:hypothetical protein [Kitasatospora sp. MBT63]
MSTAGAVFFCCVGSGFLVAAWILITKSRPIAGWWKNNLVTMGYQDRAERLTPGTLKGFGVFFVLWGLLAVSLGAATLLGVLH